MTVIGSAYVNIRAITDQLAIDVRKAIEQIKDTVTIKVDADVTAAKANIDSVAAGDQVINVSAATAVARAEFEHMRDDMNHTTIHLPVEVDDRLAELKLAFLARRRNIAITVQANSGPIKTLLGYLERLAGVRVSTGLVKDLIEEFSNLDKAVPKIANTAIKVGSIGAAAINAVAGVLTLGGSLVQVAQVGALALPGIFTGFAIGMKITTLAFSDMKKAVPALAKEFQGLKNEISQNFWATAQKPIENLLFVMPQLRNMLNSTARSLGSFWGAMATGIAQPEFLKGMEIDFANLKKSIDITTSGSSTFLHIIQLLGEYGSAFLPKLAQGFLDISKRFDAFLTRVSGDGSLQKWTDQAWATMQQLGRVISDVVNIFSTLTGAAKVAGSDGLSTLVKVLDQIRASINSPDGLNSIITIFTGAGKASSALGNGILQIFGAIGTAAPAISVSFEYIGKVIDVLAKAISSIISNPEFQAGFTAMFAGIAKGAEALLPVLGTTGPKIGALLSIIGDLAANIGGILGAALQVALPFITAFKKAIDPLIPILGDALINIIKQLGPTFDIFAKAISDVAPAVAVVVKWVADLITGLVDTLGPAIPGIVAAVVTFIAVLKTWNAIMAVTSVVKDVVAGIQLLTEANSFLEASQISVNLAFLANPIVLIVAGVIALIAVIVLAYNNIGWFKDGVDAAIKFIVDAWQNMCKWIGEAFNNTTKFIGDAWSNTSGMFTDFFNNTVGMFTDFFKNTVGMFSDWIGGIVGLVGDIGKGISDGFNGVVSFITGVIKTIGDIIWAGLSFYVSIWVTIFTTIKDIFVNIWNGIVWFFQPVVDLLVAIFKGAGDIIWAIWKGLWDIISAIFVGIWTNLVRFFTPIIQSISDTIVAVVTNVSNWWNSTWQAIVDFFVNVWNQTVAFYTPIIQGISDTITNVVTGISNWWNSTWQGIVDFFTTIWNLMVVIYTPILQGIWDFIVAVGNGIANGWNATWQGISNFFTGIWNGIIGFVTPIIQSISNTISSVITGISNTWNAVWGSIGSFISTVWNNIVNAVSGFVSDVSTNVSNFLTTIGNIGQDILNKITGFPTLLINAGRDLINGLTQGIQNASGAVVDKIKEIASGALDAIKNFFGIKSPSRVMRDEVGKQIGAGLAIGIEQSVDRVSKAAAALADAAMPDISDIKLPNIVASDGSALGASTGPAVLSRNTLTGADATSANSTTVGGTGVFGGSTAGTNVNFIVNPSAGLSEEQIGVAAVNELYWKLSLANV